VEFLLSLQIPFEQLRHIGLCMVFAQELGWPGLYAQESALAQDLDVAYLSEVKCRFLEVGMS
jgi:hypothetical protein